jgi:hypothetical protein
MRRSKQSAPAGALVVIATLLCCLAATAAAQGEVAAAATTATVSSAGYIGGAAKCTPASLSLCLAVRGKKCSGSRGMLTPQLGNDVRELASRMGVNIARSDLKVDVQLLSTKVSSCQPSWYAR